MLVREISEDAFWKGESCVRGKVADEGKDYSVTLYLKGEQVFDYACTCEKGVEASRMCPHCEALKEAYQRRPGSRNGYVSTTPSVRVMVREYTNREVARIMGEEEGELVKLLPFLKIGREGVYLSCMLGRDRLYQIKDLSAFARTVEAGEYAEYGKNLAFSHSVHAFTWESRPLLNLVAELSGALRDCYEQLRKSSQAVLPSFRSLKLGKTACDRFFDAVQGRVIAVEDDRGRERKLTVKRSNPDFFVSAKAGENGGIEVSVPQELLVYQGESRLYVADESCLFGCDEEYSEGAGVFLHQMLNASGALGRVAVNRRDAPLFYERVLKRIEALGILRTEGVNWEELRPKELKVRFEFDSRGPGQVSLCPILSYGDFSFHPLEDEKVPHDICRDVPGEFRVSRLITRYFECREDETRDLVICGDEDAVFRLLDEGMERFQALGEVWLTEAFKRLKIRPLPKISLGVSLSGGWLELKVDAGDLGKAELARILSEYGKKKKYYKMKNQEYLKLGENGLSALSSLAEGLGLLRTELQSGKIRVNSYRAMYLDSLLKRDAGIDFQRDSSFRSLVRNMKSVEDSSFELPDSLQGTLREYQKTGFRWLRTLDEYHFGGILADDMGLGKTVQIIALLLSFAESRNKTAPGTSLVVCPASLVFNWEQEFKSFAPSLKVAAVNGALSERKRILEHIEDYDVAVTSYDLLRRDLSIYREKQFRYEILDEAQFIKNAATQSARAVKAVPASTRFALTGTPVENRLSELWSIFDYLMPGFLFSYRRFKTMFEIPIVRDGEAKALENLQRMIRPFVLRRLKSDVLRELPDKLERVVYSAFAGRQRELYLANAVQLKDHLEQGTVDWNRDGRFEILAGLMRLRQICCDPSLFYTDYDGGSAKLETCMDLILSAVSSGHKLLLFSQFASMLSIIGKRLSKEGISYYILTGATAKEERSRLVSAFHKDETPVFLISLKAGGTGLNLTAADIVIHYDPWWNVAAQNQATDRAHRIGQKKQVTVFKLIMKDTIEENILKLQESKKLLADQVVTEGMANLAVMNREELMKILGI